MTGWAKFYAALLCGCAAPGLSEPTVLTAPLVLAQVPHGADARAAGDRLDLYYPPGSRVVASIRARA